LDRFERVAFSNRRARWTLRERQQSCGERRGGLVGLGLLVNGELEIGQTRQALLDAENA
jgi:hypothetical protein